VVDDEGRFCGMFSLHDIRQFLYESQVGSLAIAQDLASQEATPLTDQMSLSEAISRFAKERFGELPVVDEHDPTRVTALLRRQDVIGVYDRKLLEMRSGG
jgi:CIC family chloride channel protein